MAPTSENPESTISVTPEPKVLKRSKKKGIWKYFKEYCDNTSIHGMKYLVEERSLCERVLWLIWILTAVVACGYLIGRIWRKYNESPVIVSFATKESPIFTIPFPAVTICPMSKSDRSKFNYTRTIHKKQDNETLSPEEELHGQYFSMICEEGIDEFHESETFTDDFFDKLDELKVPFESLLPCEFMGRDIMCSDLFKPIILDEGICYTFNMLDREDIFRENVVHYSDYHQNDEVTEWDIDHGYSPDSKVDTFPKRALLSGADSALRIMLLHWVSDLDYLCVEDSQGYSVVLHTPHTIPRPTKQYFQLPFDSSVIAVIQPKMMTTSEDVKKYDPLERECYFTNERPLKFFKIYTPENCLLECLTNYTLQECGCVNFFMPRDNETSICGTGNFYCMRAAEQHLKEIELKNLINTDDSKDVKVTCDCMPLCTELSYDMEQSLTDWNWGEQLRALRIPGHEQIKQGMKVAKLSVFFKLDQFLTSQRNELYGPTDFLANFGGLLGLFTGFSLLSLMEIIYFLTVRICCNIRQYKIWTAD